MELRDLKQGESSNAEVYLHLMNNNSILSTHSTKERADWMKLKFGGVVMTAVVDKA